ncbi:MAG: transferrin-binding protein-like solute binding protein [Hyphomicrobiaceae bacterium]
MALTVALGGCGGGGGGGGGSSSAGGGAAAPVAPAVSYATGTYGKAQAVYLPDVSVSLAIGDRSAAGGQSVTYTGTSPSGITAPGNPASFSVGQMAGGATMTGINSGTLYNLSSSSDQYISSDSYTDAFVTKITGAAPLTDAVYGSYSSGAMPSGQLGGFFTGTPTSQAQMPGNITATYSGGFVGYEVTNSTVYEVAGASSVTANFGAGTVSGAVSSLTNLYGTPSAYGLSMTGTITGNTYNGTAGFTGAGAPTTTTSAMNGAFYGSAATQTAGALSVTGTGAGGATTVVGGFGGRR